MISPKSAHALPAASAVGSIASSRSISRSVSSASFSELVMRMAGALGGGMCGRGARGDDRRMRRGDHGIAAGGHVTTDRVHRDVPVTEDDAGQRLDLEIAQGLLLPLREVAHLRLRELDVIEIALADLGYRAFDLVRRKLERSRRPAVEFFRGFAHRRIAPRLDLAENSLHLLPHPRIGGCDRSRAHSALELAG